MVTIVVLYKFLWIAKSEGGRDGICQAILFILNMLKRYATTGLSLPDELNIRYIPSKAIKRMALDRKIHE